VLFEQQETLRVRALLEQQTRRFNAGDLALLIKSAKRWKPQGFDSHIAGVRKRYMGRQQDLVRAALRRRFPRTYQRMPCTPLSLLRFIASQDAAVYKAPPERPLALDGRDLPDEDERVMRYHGQLGQLAVLMPEVERRAIAAKQSLLHVTWSTTSARLVLRMYWPDHVDVLPHQSAPTDLDQAVALIARVVSPDGVVSEDEWYQVWTRAVEEEPDGTPRSFGPWQVRLMSRSGNASAASAETYAGERFPWLIYRTGIAQGSPWIDEDRDLVDVIDEFNVSRSNEMYTQDLQGHTQLVYAGHQADVAELVIGPDELLKIGPGETAIALDFHPKLSDMREGRKLHLRELATSRRNSPYAYVQDQQVVESGVARMMANIPHDEMLDEMVEFAVDFESQLLPTLVDVHDTFAPGEPIHVEGATYAMRPRRRPLPEDPEGRQRRLIEAKDEGGITEARAWTEAGYYRSVEEAVRAGLSDDLTAGRPAPPPGQEGGTLADRLRQRLTAPPASEES